MTNRRAPGLTQVKFISRLSDMGKDVKVIRVPKEDLERVRSLGKKRVLVTLNDDIFTDLK